MKAFLHSVRIAPKKANLVARMVRGMPVPEAMESLRKTNKKAARILETLLRSAIANASHNDKQDAQTMIIKEIVVNQGQAYKRGMPKARGQQRPYRKFLSHVSLSLGFASDADTAKQLKKTSKAARTGKIKAEKPSQGPQKPVKASKPQAKKQTKKDTTSTSSSN